jgi:hypothetical protein
LIIAANAQKTGYWRVKQILKDPATSINFNDGGIVSNPYFVMLNPSLRPRGESVYRYLQKYNSLARSLF